MVTVTLARRKIKTVEVDADEHCKCTEMMQRVGVRKAPVSIGTISKRKMVAQA